MTVRKRAFTLLELLTAIAVLAILAAILLPVISGILGQAKSMRDLSNLRSTTVDFYSWSQDHNGNIPNAGSPHGQSAEARAYYGMLHDDGDRGWGLYLLQNELWPNLLRESYGGQVQRYWHSSFAEFDEDEATAGVTTLVNPPSESAPENPDRSNPNTPEPDTSPGIIDEVVGDFLIESAMDYRSGSIAHLQTEYRLGVTMLTDANVWSNPGAVAMTRWVRNHARRVAFSDVANPARKGLLYHNDWPRADEGWHHVAFADGSVELKNWDDAKPTAVSPFDTTGEPGVPVNATFNGYRGIDF